MQTNELIIITLSLIIVSYYILFYKFKIKNKIHEIRYKNKAIVVIPYDEDTGYVLLTKISSRPDVNHSIICSPIDYGMDYIDTGNLLLHVVGILTGYGMYVNNEHYHSNINIGNGVVAKIYMIPSTIERVGNVMGNVVAVHKDLLKYKKLHSSSICILKSVGLLNENR